VTERAIENNQEMKVLLSGIKLLSKMSFDEIETIVILVQVKNGSAHQVLTTKETKK
jgi:hypothetical protein